MPILPLFDQAAHPDGWHNVRSPGGYEWWYFDAEDHATQTHIVVILMQGFIFHPGYLRAYGKYVSRPTKNKPPTASDFPCVYACVYRGGKIWKQFFTQYPQRDFEAKSDRVDVRIGPNRLSVDESGSYQLELVGTPWHMSARGPVTEIDQVMRVSMVFKPVPRNPPIERTFLSRAMTGAEHRWIIAAPRCDVMADIEVGDARNPLRRTPGRGMQESVRLHVAGHGYHDHNYGTAPIGSGLHRWIWGRAMFGDRVLTFHYAQPREKSLPPEVHLVEVSNTRVHDINTPQVEVDWSRTSRPAMILRYPATIRFGEELQLSNPQVIDPSPFYLRLVFDAKSRGESSQAFCEIAYPHRLNWPILGRMIEMSFDKRPTRVRSQAFI